MNYNTSENRSANYKVYVHINKINNKRYFGITKRDIKKRWGKGAPYKACTFFYNAILKYGWDGFEHIVIKEGLSQEEAMNLEIELIKKYKTTDSNFGYNIMKGGQLNIPNEEMKERRNKSIRESTSKEDYKQLRSAMNLGKNNPFYGRKHSESSKKQMSKKRLGKKLSEEHKEKVSESLKKSFVMLSKDGHFLQTFAGLKSIEEFLGGTSSHVTSCCKGKRKTAGGYKWMYLEDYKKLESAN